MLGSQGEDVAKLQTMLRDLGFSEINPDGKFGKLTFGALREVQASFGLARDGKAGRPHLGQARSAIRSLSTSAGGAFGVGAVPFEYWLHVILVPRLNSAASGEMAIPRASSVAAHAVREWAGAPDRDRLIELLTDLDEIVQDHS